MHEIAKAETDQDMTEAEQVKPEDIWADDLLGRKEEALLLQGYLESVASPTSPANRGSFVLAVDAGYGEGKTFFLERLTKQLRVNHPVAYVDAWKDDLANDPLAAIVATLEDAFQPYLKDEKIKAKFGDFLASTARIGSILALGVAKRLASLAVTEGAVKAASGVLSLDSESRKDARSIFEGATSDAANAVASSSQQGDMKERVRVFREGKDAIDRVKASLSALVLSLDQNSDHPPIFVVIDELDRCRPTYAIELLEQAKHLFDVPGVVFVLGINTQQLAHSVSGAYGSAFDGLAYLDRFVTRRYRLASVNLKTLLHARVVLKKIGLQALYFPPCWGPRGGIDDPEEIICEYFQAYDFAARDVIKIVDWLETSFLFTRRAQLFGPFFLPVLLTTKKLGDWDQLLLPSGLNDLFFELRFQAGGDKEKASAAALAHQVFNYAKMSTRVLSELQAKQSENLLLKWLLDDHRTANTDRMPLSSPFKFKELCNAVGRTLSK